MYFFFSFIHPRLRAKEGDNLKTSVGRVKIRTNKRILSPTKWTRKGQFSKRRKCLENNCFTPHKSILWHIKRRPNGKPRSLFLFFWGGGACLEEFLLFYLFFYWYIFPISSHTFFRIYFMPDAWSMGNFLFSSFIFQRVHIFNLDDFSFANYVFYK